ncbi:ankyrin repeat domain-containing protein [bacterium]|nr:ankyrin repeat domain-containing protein [bacterium]
MPPIHPAIRLLISAILLGLLAGCPAERSADTAEGTASTTSSVPPDGSDESADSGRNAAAASDGDTVPDQQMTWRAYIDPQMSIEEIEALSEDEARAKLEELDVPFEAENFHEAIEMDPLELCALFLQAGMPVDTPNLAGVSPLQAAAYKQKLQHMQLFIEHGADVNYEDPRFRATPVDFAVGGGNVEVLQLLLDNGADPAGGSQSRPILLDAIESGSPEMFEFVYERFPDLDVADRSGQGTLMNACLAGHLEIVRRLVELGVDVNQTEPMGGMPVGAAAFRGKWDIVDFLVQHGADPLASYRGNRNLLFEFGMYPDYPHEMVVDLVERGLDINQIEERSGQTPLISAASNGNTRLVEFLLEQGADPAPVDVNGFTACDYAVYTQNGDMVMAFSRFGITSDRQFPQQ